MIRNQINWMTACAASALAMFASAPSVFAEVPPAPAGYSSETAIKAAFFAGMLKAIDVNLPVPDSIKVEKGIEYGKGGDVQQRVPIDRLEGARADIRHVAFLDRARADRRR